MLRGLFPYFIAVFSGLTASLSPVLGKPLYEVIHPFQAVFLFGVFGFISIAFLLLITRSLKWSVFRNSSRLKRIALMGYLFQSLPLFFINYGLVGTPSVIVLMMKRIQPVLLLFLLFVLKKKKPKLPEVLISIFAVSGIYLLINRVGFSLEIDFFLNVRLFAVFCSVVLWALMFVYAKNLLHDMDSLHASMGIMFCIASSMVIPAFYDGFEWLYQMQPRHWYLALGTGLFCYGWGLPAVYFGLKRFSPFFMSIAMLAGPIIAAFTASIFFDEAITCYQVAGGGMVLLSLLCMTFFREYTRRTGEG